MPVESTGSGKSLVERLGKVRSSDDDDTFRLLESVQLDQKLVERLLHVVLMSARSAFSCPKTYLILGGTLRADCIQLIDEDDRRGLLSRSVKQLPDSLG